MTTVGFSGSRNLSDEARLHLVIPHVDQLRASDYVTGACIGVDWAIGMHLYNRQPWASHAVIVPADRSRVFAWWTNFPDVQIHEMPPGTSYENRNQAIVDASDHLVVFPEYPEDDPRSARSGTWQTTRMARRKGIPVDVHLLCVGAGES